MLLEQFDAADVCFDAELRQVCVENGDSDRTLVRVLDVVEGWVTASRGEPTTIQVDGRSYTMGPAASIGSWR